MPSAPHATVRVPGRPPSSRRGRSFTRKEDSWQHREAPGSAFCSGWDRRSRSAAEISPAASRHVVLAKLAQAADEIGKMPPRAVHPTPLYRKLEAALAAR